MIALTPEQARLLRYIGDFIHETGGAAPSIREMAVFLGKSATSVSSTLSQVEALEEHGYIRRLPRRARAIEVLHASSEYACPNCGFRSSNSHGLKTPEPGFKLGFRAAKTTNDRLNALPARGER